MFAVAVHNWLIFICGTFGVADSQMPMPYPVSFPGVVHMVPGPPQPVPVPVPMPVPYGVPIPYEISSATTTTTTPKPCQPAEAEETDQPTIKIYIPWPPQGPWPNFPLFPNMSIPSFENFTLNLPPQLPYQLGPPVVPMPMPLPIPPPPPPLVMIPIPPMIKIKPHPEYRESSNSKSSSSDSDDSDDSDSSSAASSSERDRSKKKQKKKGKNKYGIYRSNRRLLRKHSSDEEVIRPVLTLESKYGDIKLQKRLNMKEAARLMENVRKSEKKAKSTGNSNSGKSSGADNVKLAKNQRRSQEPPKNTSQFSIANGHKELVFKVPNNKTISNLTVSFDITK